MPSPSTGYPAEVSEHEDEGQVSEVVRLDPEDADTPISDSEQVAGYPESESGAPDEGRSIRDVIRIVASDPHLV